VLNIVPHTEVLVRQMSLENPMEKALACHLEIGAPTVGHDPAITTAYENRWAIFRRVSGGFLRQLIFTLARA